MPVIKKYGDTPYIKGEHLMAREVNPELNCTGLVRPRIPEDAAYTEAPGQAPVTSEIVNQLNALDDPRVRLVEDIGVRVLEDDSTEATDNIPRLFVLTANPDDPRADEVKDLRSAGIRFGSVEFWKEVQKGNIFAYPAGSANPVQLRLDTSIPGKPVFGYSKPIDPEDIPMREHPVPDPAPSRPGRFTRWLNRTLGLFQGTIDQYNRKVQDYEAYQQRRNSLLNPIRQQTEARSSNQHLNRETAKVNQRLKAEDDAKLSAVTVDSTGKYITELYGTKPVRHAHFTLEDVPEKQRPLSKYSKSQFDELKPYDLELDKIKIGNSGTSVTEEDFAAVSMFAATQYKHMKNALDHNKEEADWMLDDLKAYEISDPEQRRADSINTMVTMDIVRDISGPRENIGNFFKDVFQPAREEAKEAFENYKLASSAKNAAERKNLKSGLGSLIAVGVNSAANYVKNKATLSHQDRQMVLQAGRLINMMEKDPELKAIAEEKGMNPEKLKSVQGMIVYDKLARDRDLAVQKLKTAVAYGTPLSKEQKKDCAEKIIKAGTFEAMFKSGYSINSEKGDYKRLYDKLMNPDNLKMAPQKKHPVTGAFLQLPWKECPPLKNGNVYIGSPLSKVQEALQIEKMPEPEIAVLLSNPQGQKWLDDFARNHVSRMDLDEMNSDALDSKLKTDLGSANLVKEGADSMMKVFAAEKKAEKVQR